MILKPASIFSNHMVLQRNKPIALFGEGDNGLTVNACLSNAQNPNNFTLEGSCRVKDGKWLMYLPPSKAQTNCVLTLSCGDTTLTYDNIAIGEVWFCGGQSNMEFELQNATDGTKHLAEDTPNVRFYNVSRLSFIDEAFYEAEAANHWQEFNADNAKTWSAVGYLYGKQLSEKLGVTVGLIGCNWGGTSACTWMSEDYLRSDENTASYLADYEDAIKGKDPDKLIRRYKDYMVYDKEWSKKRDALYAVEPDISWNELQNRIGLCLWPGPMCAIHPFRPGRLYETMIQRVTPYTIKGFIYYQGESDEHKPQLYAKMLTLLIRQWRSDWKDDGLPFLFVQLPGHRFEQDADTKSWCILREMQTEVYRQVPCTGMAVAIDCGEFNEIHPKDKNPVADRLYRQALYHVYGGITEEEACAPLFQSLEITPDTATVHFTPLTDDLVLHHAKDSDTSVIGFEAAGEDLIYHPVPAHLDGKKIILDVSTIHMPKAVRYLWTNYPEYDICLYNRYGLPVAPFCSISISD